MSSLTLSDDAMQGVMAKAIVDSLTPERRDELIRTAIQNTLKPPINTYGKDNRSAFQVAFDRAVENTVDRIAREYLETDTAFQEKMKALFDEAVDNVFADETSRAQMAANIAEVFRKGLMGY